MNFSASIGAAFLLLSASLAGQQQAITPPASTAGTTLFVAPAPSGSCPVAMRAQHGSGYGLVRTRNPEHDKTPPKPEYSESRKASQSVHLVLTNSKQAVVQAIARVRGLTAKGGVTNARYKSDATPDIARTVRVRFDVENGQSQADLLLPDFAVVTSVQLVSLTYAGGSSWKIGTGDACRVRPDPLMLVSER